MSAPDPASDSERLQLVISAASLGLVAAVCWFRQPLRYKIAIGWATVASAIYHYYAENIAAYGFSDVYWASTGIIIYTEHMCMIALKYGFF
jgi:hypothetical protein